MSNLRTVENVIKILLIKYFLSVLKLLFNLHKNDYFTCAI